MIFSCPPLCTGNSDPKKNPNRNCSGISIAFVSFFWMTINHVITSAWGKKTTPLYTMQFPTKVVRLNAICLHIPIDCKSRKNWHRGLPFWFHQHRFVETTNNADHLWSFSKRETIGGNRTSFIIISHGIFFKTLQCCLSVTCLKVCQP